MSAKEALDRLVAHTLAVSSQEVFAALKNYFSMRYRANEHAPRFCIKLLNKQEGGDVIYTFARDQGAPFKGEINFETACEKNTGFQDVSQSRSPYFCNDITAQKGAYKNPRLNPDRVRSYRSSVKMSVKRYFAKNPIADVEWINCWIDGDDKKSPPASSSKQIQFRLSLY